MIKILFLAANPSDTTRLGVAEEYRAVHRRIRESEYRDSFDLRQHGAVRVKDLHPYLLQYRPHILHFSGHASSANEIILEDDTGLSRSVGIGPLGRLFSILRDEIRCVVLNSCYSQPQAEEIARHIDCVVGMSQAIADADAINFASSFYLALGYGRSVKTAFDLGVNAIDFGGSGATDTPRLLCHRADPDKIVFARGRKPHTPEEIIEFTRGLLDADEHTRIEAATRITGPVDEPLAALLIERSAADPSPNVRSWLNRALGRVASPESLEALRSNVYDANPYAALGAQDALDELSKSRTPAEPSEPEPTEGET